MSALGAVAYLRGTDLHVVDVSSTLDQKLVIGAAPIQHGYGTSSTVRWSPDGRWIAFGAGNVVPSGGGPTCQPLARSVDSWSWSPATDELAGVTRSGGLVIGGPEQAPSSILPSGWGASAEFGPAFDPTGRFVALSRLRIASSGIPAQGSLWIVDLSTGHAQELRRARGALPIVAGWSPDANWILWWKDVGFSSSIAADGLELLATSIEGTTKRIVSPVLVHQDFLTWCGDRLVVAAGGFRDVRSGKRLFIASPPSWQASTSPNDRPPNWIWPSCSPDGRQVAATAGIPPPSQRQRTIWLEALGGSGRHQLFPSSSSRADDLPRWSRDAGSILFVRRTIRRRPSAALFLASVDPRSGWSLGVTGPIANLGSSMKGYDLGYGYYSWSEGTDWFQPNG